eukprot:4365341-Pyramimonas_sp.AAC.1
MSGFDRAVRMLNRAPFCGSGPLDPSELTYGWLTVFRQSWHNRHFWNHSSAMLLVKTYRPEELRKSVSSSGPSRPAE